MAEFILDFSLEATNELAGRDGECSMADPVGARDPASCVGCCPLVVVGNFNRRIEGPFQHPPQNKTRATWKVSPSGTRTLLHNHQANARDKQATQRDKQEPSYSYTSSSKIVFTTRKPVSIVRTITT